MTCDHLMPLLRNSGDSELFCELAQEVAKARECHSFGKDDSIEETFRRGARNCCGRCVAEVGGPHSRAGFGQQFQGSHRTTPIRPYHKVGVRVHRPRASGIN